MEYFLLSKNLLLFLSYLRRHRVRRCLGQAVAGRRDVSKNGFKKTHRETKTMTFIRKKTIIGFMVLLCFIMSVASAGARAYPAAGSNATTFIDPLVPVEPMKVEDDPKLLYVCGYPCCGINNRGACNKCCPKGKPHPPKSPMDDNPLVRTESTNPIDVEKVVYRCGYPCCGRNYRGKCNRCCPL